MPVLTVVASASDDVKSSDISQAAPLQSQFCCLPAGHLCRRPNYRLLVIVEQGEVSARQPGVSQVQDGGPSGDSLLASSSSEVFSSR